MKYNTVITDLGRKKLASVVTTKSKIELTQFVIGDSNGTDYTPTGSETSLKNETYRNTINSKDIDPDNIEQIRLELIVPANIGGFYIRELGIYDADGDLFAITGYPATYKPSPIDGAILKQFIIKVYLQVVNTDNVTLTVKAENLVSRDYVDNTLRATQEQTNKGISNNYVTPSTLQNKLALPQWVTHDMLADSSITPKKMQTGVTFEFDAMAIPRGDGHTIVFDYRFMGLRSHNRLTFNGFTFDDFDRPKLTTINGDSRIASLQDIIDLSIVKAKAVTHDMLADASVTADKIADDSINTTKIINKAITTDKLADSSITTDKIANDSIITTKINDKSITTEKIADGNITPEKVQKGVDFEFGAVVIPRKDGNKMVCNNRFIGLENSSQNNWSGFYFDDFDAPRFNTSGDNRVASIQNIINNGSGIVYSDIQPYYSVFKFSNGMMLQRYRFGNASSQSNSDWEFQLLMAYSRDFATFVNIISSANQVFIKSQASSLHSVIVQFFNEPSAIKFDVFCIGV